MWTAGHEHLFGRGQGTAFPSESAFRRSEHQARNFLLIDCSTSQLIVWSFGRLILVLDVSNPFLRERALA